jgi:hypothetical protein
VRAIHGAIPSYAGVDRVAPGHVVPSLDDNVLPDREILHLRSRCGQMPGTQRRSGAR